MRERITQVASFLRGLRSIRVLILAIIGASMLVGCRASDPTQEIRDQIAAGQYRDALEPLRGLIKENPEDSELLFLYGKVLFRTGQPGLAEWPLRKSQADPEWFVRASILVAKTELAGGNHMNAAETYAKILEVEPDNMTIRIQRANVCARSPLLREEALAEVDRILEIDPTQLSAFKPRILAYLGLNRPEDARAVLEELGARIEKEQPADTPLRGWYCATMAIMADDSDDESRARELWSTCTEDYPTNDNVVRQSISFYEERKEFDRALEIAQAALDAAPSEDSGYRILAASLLRRLDRPDEAGALLVEGAERAVKPITRSAAYLALTEHYNSVGDVSAAADALETGLAITRKIGGPQPDLLFSLADLRVQLGELDTALALASKMTVAAHRALVRGAVAQRRREYEVALNAYDEATRLWPDNPYAPYYGAQAALALGRVERAFDGFLLSIRIDETATDARLQAARMLVAEGRFSSAREMLGSTRVPPSTDASLLGIEMAARRLNLDLVLDLANKFSESHPELFGQAIAIVAEGVVQRDDEHSAWTIVEPYLSLGFPPHNHLPILLAAAEWARGDEQLALVESLVGPALETRPPAALARSIEGVLHERSGESQEAAASYQAALDIDADSPMALFRLAAIVAESDPNRALELLSRALELPFGPESTMAARLFMAATTSLADSPEFEAVLVAGLDRMPTSGRIAYRLATLLEDRGDEDERVLWLAVRATRFGVGEDAIALRNRVRTRL